MCADVVAVQYLVSEELELWKGVQCDPGVGGRVRTSPGTQLLWAGGEVSTGGGVWFQVDSLRQQQTARHSPYCGE